MLPFVYGMDSLLILSVQQMYESMGLAMCSDLLIMSDMERGMCAK